MCLATLAAAAGVAVAEGGSAAGVVCSADAARGGSVVDSEC